MPYSSLFLMLCLIILSCPACQQAVSSEISHKSQYDTTKNEDNDGYDGRIIPTKATELRAPQNVFKVLGWWSESGSTKLVELLPEGSNVKKDDVVARFDFRYKRALEYVEQRQREVDAEASKSAIDLEAQLQSLIYEYEKKKIEREIAKLNTLKAKAISKRQLKLYEIDYRLAEFDVKALEKRIQALKNKIASEAAYHREQIAKMHEHGRRYNMFESRFKLYAPHAGIVRHAYNKREHRKMQKGDGMQAGTHVVSIAEDESLSVEFFVPEAEIKKFTIGMNINVLSLMSGKYYSAMVKHIETFPQELGFLKDDELLPSAREKAFVIRADFKEKHLKLATGGEIKVSIE